MGGTSRSGYQLGSAQARVPGLGVVGVGLGHQLGHRPTPLEVELGDLVGHVVALLDHLPRPTGEVDLLRIEGEPGQIPGEPQLEPQISCGDANPGSSTAPAAADSPIGQAHATPPT